MSKLKIPRYKPNDDNCVVILTPQATSKKVFLQSCEIKLIPNTYKFNTQITQLDYCRFRIVPKIDHYSELKSIVSESF
jgi:hypothetical protein